MISSINCCSTVIQTHLKKSLCICAGKCLPLRSTNIVTPWHRDWMWNELSDSLARLQDINSFQHDLAISSFPQLFLKYWFQCYDRLLVFCCLDDLQHLMQYLLIQWICVRVLNPDLDWVMFVTLVLDLRSCVGIRPSISCLRIALQAVLTPCLKQISHNLQFSALYLFSACRYVIVSTELADLFIPVLYPYIKQQSQPISCLATTGYTLVAQRHAHNVSLLLSRAVIVVDMLVEQGFCILSCLCGVRARRPGWFGDHPHLKSSDR